MNTQLLDILVCPLSKAPLVYHADKQELWCRQSKLAYPIRDGIPVMMVEEARELSAEECAA
ncbi:uncharacterized protein YbaR (Trm112 family) [Neisseria sp. HSC-16F19]|nr:Trm112 family protein [Neisseria sp. HSC-16F19]MCP2039467.1 uncharacterized protein YbaR (Trm112 family) [Neisseria sp. HSC-16F19]